MNRIWRWGFVCLAAAGIARADYQAVVSTENSNTTFASGDSAFVTTRDVTAGVSQTLIPRAGGFTFSRLTQAASGKLNPGDTFTAVSRRTSNTTANIKSVVGFRGGISGLHFSSVMGSCTADAGTFQIKGSGGWTVPSGSTGSINIKKVVGSGTACDAQNSADQTASDGDGYNISFFSWNCTWGTTCKYCFWGKELNMSSGSQYQTTTQGICTLTSASGSCSLSCDSNT